MIIAELQNLLSTHLGEFIRESNFDRGELTIEIAAQDIKSVCLILRDNPVFRFEMLMDLAGVDYLHYGLSEWTTDSATSTGFERGVKPLEQVTNPWTKPRFAVAYHLLSIFYNHRLRIKVFLPEENPMVDSVTNIWPSANWYEREAFDLYGILFANHPDLRRILTDYGFVGHPFRKDFPLSGHVEVRYDKKQKRVIYEPVDITPRVLVPKIIRTAELKKEGI